jgi:hypothetical protein
MLRMMLSAHPELAIPWESHFIVPMWKARKRFGDVRAPDVEHMLAFIQRTSMFQLWEVPEEVVRRHVEALREPSFADVIGAVFQAYADQQGKSRWGDKTPIYVLWIPVLAELFPSGRFVHVIRDGRDVALSYLSVPWGPTDIWGCASKWRRDVGTGLRDGRALGDDRCLEIRYEELVRDTRATLERICRHAGLTFDEGMLEYHRASSVGARDNRAEYHTAATKPPTPGLRDWRTQMAPDQLLAFEAIAGDLLSELGYERGAASIPSSTRIEAAARTAVLTGKEMGSKLKRQAVRIRRGRDVPTPDSE